MVTSSAAIRALAGVALAAVIAASALAGSLSVTPLTVTLDGSTRSAALTVKNEGNEARVVQVELARWTQNNGQDVLAPTGDLLVNPPLATVQPGQSQTIRIGLRRGADSAQERAYRLYITGIPPPSDEANGLRIALRLGVPIYVAPVATASARVRWGAGWAPNGEVVLTLANDGNRHVRIDGFKVVDPSSGRVLGASRPHPFTLLAGQARRYALGLPPGWHGRQLKLQVATGDGPSETSIDVPPPAAHAAAPVRRAARASP